MIKKVTYRGFKSFADTIEVDFSKGLTTVIGPNGCGKSNIVDGIRWVLGEQSAKSLRGGKMEDIIFHGTTKRKELNSAEVTMVLDNSHHIFKKIDTEEVSVTRRAFRKGRSEYLINGEIVKLEDVQNLFMDSGIGSRSYSLIGQEQSKKILSTKMEERRAIFEEAAGIVKSKQQKEQTEKRLKEVDTHLTRMDDILHELKSQLNPLKKQAEKAQKHKGISTELHTLEIQYLLHQYDFVKNELDTLQGDTDTHTTAIETMEQELSDGENRLADLKQRYQQENEDIFVAQNELSELKESIDRTESDINLRNERKQHATSNQEECRTQREEIENKYRLSMEEYHSKQQRSAEMKTEMVDLRTELETLNSDIHSVENDKLHLINDYEFTRQKSVDLYNLITQKQFERDQAKEKERDMKEKRYTIEASIATIQEDYEQSKEQYENINASYATIEKERDEHASQLASYNEQLAEATESATQLTDESNALNQREFELKTKADSIESQLSHNHGFFDGVKTILKEKKKGDFEGVYGALAELVTVEKEAEVAIDTLLQSAMQSLVTKDDATAKNCIHYLNQEKAGRATFLPINLARSSSFNKEELERIQETNGLTPAMDAVTCTDEVKTVVESKLGRSLIADNLDVALAFVKKSKLNARISTRQGEIVQTGSITGGTSGKQKANFFTQKRELEEYKKELADLSSRKITVQTALGEKETQITSLKETIRSLNMSVEEQSKQLNELYASLKDTENRYQRINEKHQDLSAELDETVASYNESSQKVVQLKSEMERLEKEQDETKEKLESLHSEKETQNGSLSAMLRRINDIQTRLAGLEVEENQLDDYMQKYGQNAQEIDEKIRLLNEKEREETQTITQLEEDILTLCSSLKQQQASYDLIKNDLNQKRALTQDAIAQMDALEEQVKTQRTEKEGREKALNKQQITYGKRDTEMKNILTRLADDYSLTEEDLVSFERQDIDRSNAKKEVDRMRKEIATLGNINHEAIEQYETLSVRYETESTQFEDAKNAKKDLTELIGQIEEEMTVKFMETFSEIAQNFEQTFVSLFEGGSARLRLMDEKNPLTSEIDILAQPPGKVQKSISLLSGGEQSLSAVALIFAIILAKPSPFVILDEVDAPLDDSNIARFANYLKKLSKENQFIVITHRKGTKMVSDFIYGVTHEELGVSVVAPVKLDFNEKTG